MKWTFCAKFLLPTLIAATLTACNLEDVPNLYPEQGHTDHPQEMRDFVGSIQGYARGLKTGFIVIGHGALPLLSTNELTSGDPDSVYIRSLDGVAQDAVFYGHAGIDQPTSDSRRNSLQSFLDMARNTSGTTIMVTDFAISEQKIDNAYQLSNDAGYLGFVADHTELDNIPIYPTQPYNINRRDIFDLDDASNFLVLTDTRLHSTRQQLVDELVNTDYDVIVLDFFFNGEEFTANQIRQLQRKSNGRARKVLATVNIGHAENNRYYWENHWVSNPPDWLNEQIPGNNGLYYVNYWNPAWQDIISGDEDSYIYKIANAGFDGAYLQGLDAYEHFQD
ncbi:endo alpha-1,4 polygalactosaminidase [uncultured Microbulbifer sp.]|uniref:endo alpha-1,4 polygalactosaminidase n=1 Tax=uncultured Microbulbifer sp. TaxID=348147 RepID=UPI0026289531|nr:endo alpha-1,4 polygalactosaminidase [uncultured Microbulbifer sp.]